MNEQLRAHTASPDTPIRAVLQKIDTGIIRIVGVVDEEGRLIGSVTDGDIRRGILRQVSVDAPVREVMHPTPLTAPRNVSWRQAFERMSQHALRQLFVIDDEGKLLDILSDDGKAVGVARQAATEIHAKSRDVSVFILAGGLGSRLAPLTEKTPKPLLNVGDKPLLTTTLSNLRDQGFRKIYLSVNYKAEMFKEHLGTGESLGVQITYLEEGSRLGTAGPLSLLPELSEPVLVMNGDVLTAMDYKHLLDFHRDHGGQATMCVREYSFTVPYGVVGLEGHRITQIEEKPVQTFFINAGIYILEPEAVRRVPHGTYYDMTDLFEDLTKDRALVSAFPIREYWLDIGRMEDYEQAQRDFGTLA